MSTESMAPAGDYYLLRSAIDDIANQLCATVDGRFDFTVVLSHDDTTLQKLAMLVNFLLDSARRALADLEEREARMRSIVETAAEGIITITEDGIIQSFNAAAADMFGYAAAEVLGRNVSLLMPSPYAENHDHRLADYLRTGQAQVFGVRREVKGKRRDGTTFFAHLSISEVASNNRRLFTGIVHDLTQQKKLQCELSQALKLESIGQLAAGIAHEINTPMQYVGDNTRFLRDAFGGLQSVLDQVEELISESRRGAATGQIVANIEATAGEIELSYLKEEIPSAIEQSLDGVGRVAEIVCAMKEFSHPGAAEKHPVNINQIIENTIVVARNEWKYVAQVSTDLASDLPQVLGRAGDLNQVVLNLIVNAAHAIAERAAGNGGGQGDIKVSTRGLDRWVEIRIADTGCGIPEEIRSRIYDPFFTTKEVGRGTGQGLAIAYSIITEKHGGKIEFETEVGKGTTFVVQLPVDCQEQT